MGKVTLKQKTISGILWSAIDNFASQGVHFIVGLILARLLTPREFGLIGMITIFIAISRSFIDSGFSQALIRKKDCSNADYSTVFFYNMAMGALLYFLLFVFAKVISDFFNEPQLKWIIRALGLELLISSVTLIQRSILVKRIDFKLQTKITVLSSILSGAIGIVMAMKGFGVWSLVIRTLSGAFFGSLFLWFWNRWRPVLIFSIESFRELFGFGSRLLFSGLIDTTYRNIYNVIIGKYFSAQELGFYTRANMFKDLPSKQLTSIISRVTYPVLAQMQDDKEALKAGYKKMIKSIMFVSFVLMAGMASIAEPMILTLIGEQWRPSIVYLQLLCFVGMMYPVHALNLNMLQIQGRSDLFLKLEIFKKILAIPTIIIGIFWGIKVMILGMWVNSLIAYYLNSYYSGRYINYPIREQVIDLMPSFILALLMGALVILVGRFIPFTNLPKLILQILFGGLLVFSLSELFKIDAYLYVKGIVKEKLMSFCNDRK